MNSYLINNLGLRNKKYTNGNKVIGVMYEILKKCWANLIVNVKMNIISYSKEYRLSI